MKKTDYSNPPKNHKIILFDGICKLCNGWCQFIIKVDKQRVFKLASVQSKEGQQILEHFNMPTKYFNTMLYVDGTQSYEKSDAFIKIINQLNLPWKAMAIILVIPKPIRDWLYDRIALNRYYLFGQYNQCLLPTPDHSQRFLKNDN